RPFHPAVTGPPLGTRAIQLLFGLQLRQPATSWVTRAALTPPPAGPSILTRSASEGEPARTRSLALRVSRALTRSEAGFACQLQNGVQENERLAPRFANRRRDPCGNAEVVMGGDLAFFAGHGDHTTAANDGESAEALGAQFQTPRGDAGDGQLQPPYPRTVGRRGRNERVAHRSKFPCGLFDFALEEHRVPEPVAQHAR